MGTGSKLGLLLSRSPLVQAFLAINGKESGLRGSGWGMKQQQAGAKAGQQPEL
jgi:hypothetical protein